jgi:thiol-disulfide isomerase/thioredoxin
MVNDTTIDQEVLIDYCDRTGLESGEFGAYYALEYEDYIVNDSLVKLISNKINKFDITIVFGSWCSDSEQQVPHFYKILDQAGYDDSQLKIIAVNRQKKADEVHIEDLQIELVPTFIIYQKDKEIGRIVETPVEILEEDLWQIIQ